MSEKPDKVYSDSRRFAKVSGRNLGRIYFSIFGSGLGHVTRTFEIAQSLRTDHDEFRFSCSSQAFGYLHALGLGKSVLSSPPLDVEWDEEKSFWGRDFLVHFPYIFDSFLKQISSETEGISRFSPDIVVSDSRLSPVVGARMNSRPVITLLNQFKVLFPGRFRSNRLGRFYERISGDVLGLLWSLSDEVLMTDLPPPYTIGEANVEGTDVSNVVKYVGFTSSRKDIDQESLSSAKRLLDIDGRPLVFFQVSGPEETKKRLVDMTLKATGALADRYNVVVSIGRMGGSSEPQRLSNGAWLYDWCPIKDELFELSDLVVARSGHRTIGQCIDSGTPAVLIPIHNHSEQVGNARRFSELGLGVEIESKDLTPRLLTDSVDQCLNDSSYSSKVASLMEISRRYDGIAKCAEIIDSYR